MSPAGGQTERMERYARRMLLTLGVAGALAAAVHGALLLWARHEFTQVESVVGFHVNNLAEGRGLYYDLNRYPYTISPYTPCFYLAAAALKRMGAPVPHGGRMLSFLAFLGVVALSWRILQLETRSRFAVWTGTLLAATTGNLVFWATVGQVDFLALLFSLAALYEYLQYRKEPRARRLAAAGALVFLSVFTKQTMVSAGATILILLALEDRRRAAWFAALVGGPGVALALALNWLTSGAFFENAVFSNLVPFSWSKLLGHAKYLLAAGGGLLVITSVGLRFRLRPVSPLWVYLGLAMGLLALTSPKIGSDLNYQIEPFVLLALCAALSLDRLGFFPACFRGDRGPVTLLQIPLFLHLVLNLAISGNLAINRAINELLWRQEYAQLEPYLRGEHRVLSVQLDPLLRRGRQLEVEPLIYTLMVEAGRVDPEPLRRDLAAKRFDLVILYEDLFGNRGQAPNPELPRLPAMQLEEIRKNYRLVAHVAGPLLDGDYLYQPVR